MPGWRGLDPKRIHRNLRISELVRTLQFTGDVAAELLDDPAQLGRQFLDLLGLVS